MPILFADAAFLKNDEPDIVSPMLSPIVHPPPPASLLRNGHFQISNEQLYDQSHLSSHNPTGSNKIPNMYGRQGFQQQDPRSLYDELQRRLQIKTTELNENCEELQTLQPNYKSGHLGNEMMMYDQNITNRITATGSPGSASSSGNSSGSGGSYGSQGDGKTVRFSDMDMRLGTPELPDHLDDLFPPTSIALRGHQNNTRQYGKYADDSSRGNSSSTTSLSETTKGSSRKIVSRPNGTNSHPRGSQDACSTNGAPNGAKPKSLDNVGDTDSNSDTGLSSLHSSSDEGTYVLDTLV